MVEEINEIITWYTNLPVGYNNVNDLMYARQRLSGYLFHYTTELGNLRKLWNETQSMTENERAKIQVKEFSHGIGKSEIIAKANTSKLFEAEKQAEGCYYSHRDNMEAIKEVLNSLNQSIAIARDELARKNYQP